MFNVILEGPDNAGKTTLSLALYDVTGMPIKKREGKPATFEETIEKIVRYLDMGGGMILDRHPLITQMIYGSIVRQDPPIPVELKNRFAEQKNLIVYCRCIQKGLSGHEPGPGDTDQHLLSLAEQYDDLVAEYDTWALRHAHIIYHSYDQIYQVMAMIKGAMKSL